MKIQSIILSIIILAGMSSCVGKKKFNELQSNYNDQKLALDAANKDLANIGGDLRTLTNKLETCNQENARLKASDQELKLRKEQMEDLRNQITQLSAQNNKQLETVGDLTVLSKSANDNISETLKQLEGKDKYINVLQNARTKADSINLALAVNLKSVLAQGIADQDVEIKVDKTVVFINLSDKMLYQSGSSRITARADEVLGKIAKIIQSKPDFEVMVEGYTDNVPINSSCMQDNWDLSVKRATSVVRALQKTHGINPNRLIAAGRGEYNALASNDTAEGKAMNRRTRIIILPKLDQFYDLLAPQDLD